MNESDLDIDSKHSERFIEALYQEKTLHKEQRHKHVLHKLVLSATFFGLGQFKTQTGLLHLFLYVVPLIALVHDLYIIAEDRKVKRIGYFLRDKIGQLPTCSAEQDWEKWLPTHRDPWGAVASMLYTTIITVFAAFAVYVTDFAGGQTDMSIYYGWLVLCAVSILVVFGGVAGMRVNFVYITPYDSMNNATDDSNRGNKDHNG